MSLSRRQIDTLLKPIKPSRVFQANGQAHVPAYDVAAHLTRIFGFGGWDKRILSLDLVCEEQAQTSGGREAWRVTYRCTMALLIRDPDGDYVASWEDGACGTSMLPQRGEAHDMALKSAVSYALKRCAAFGLGDQFGLGLYNKGATGKLVGVTLVTPDGPANDVDLESHIPEPRSLGNDERHVDEEPVDVELPQLPPEQRADGKAKALAIRDQVKVEQ